VERGKDGLRPEITRSEWALAVTCVVLTVFTLATFLIAGGGKGKSASKATGSSQVAARSTAKKALSAEKALSSKEALSSKQAVSPKKAQSQPLADTPSPVAPVTPTPAVPPASARPGLAQLLVDAAPQGYVELSPRSGPSGAFNLTSFTRASWHPGQDRAVLSQNGFRQGFVRSWEKPGASGPSRLVASVFEFSDPTGARALADYETFLVAKEDGGVPFPVDGGSGLSFVHREGSQTVHGYSVTLGGDDGLLFYFGALYSTAQPPDEVLLVARRQLELLRQPAAP
jgi:hypothetical protein